MLSLAGLESTCDHLAEAIDTAGADTSALMLTQLLLLLAQEPGDAGRVKALMHTALADL
jgi:hypothetical protein